MSLKFVKLNNKEKPRQWIGSSTSTHWLRACGPPGQLPLRPSVSPAATHVARPPCSEPVGCPGSGVGQNFTKRFEKCWQKFRSFSALHPPPHPPTTAHPSKPNAMKTHVSVDHTCVFYRS